MTTTEEPAGEILSVAPTYHHGSLRPIWVDRWASMPRDLKISMFDSFSLERQIEAAVFMRLDRRPSDVEWIYRIGKARPQLVAESALKRMISEPDDSVVFGLVDVISVATHYGARADKNWEYAQRRVDKIENDWAKYVATEKTAVIAKKSNE